MKEVLERLVDLQKVDQNLSRLKALRGDLPHQVEMLQQDVNQVKIKHKEQQNQLQNFRKEKDSLELEIKDLESKLSKYQDQLYHVKNNREYDAVSMEIENVKEQISNKETRVIELITLEEEMDKVIAGTNEEEIKVQEQLDAKENDLKKRMGETEEQEKSLQKERTHLAEKLNTRLLSTYQRIFNAKNGVAVVPVVRQDLCGGCYKNLPPQRVLEIREMRHMVLCEVCGRILIWDENAAEEGV